jgi:hypothetical protein
MRIADTKRLIKPHPRRSVYSADGADRLGDFQQREAGIVARDRRGATIGTFNTATEAIDAIATAADVP